MARQVKKKPNPRSKGRKAPYRGKESQMGSKQDRREEEIANTGAAMSRSNPLSLYTKFSQFAEDAGRIAFSRPLGATFDLVKTDGGNFLATTPGVMRIAFAPTVGVSSDFTSPLNRSSVNYYARIRSTQKAFGDYDHQDLTMMILAIDSAIMYHALGRRIYATLTDMTPVNRYYPRGIIGAAGVSFPDSQKNIQDFRAFLNEFALQVEQYALPKNIALFERHSWMCEGLYVDSDSTRAQTYMFVPTGFWVYDNTTTTGSQLKWLQYLNNSPTGLTQYTIDEFMDIGRSLINAMSNDADFATMAGDLYAYYGGDVMKLPYIEERYTILPRYDEIVLSQIENAVIMGTWGSQYTPVISQDPSVNAGAIIFEPVVNCGVTAPFRTIRMNMHKDSPSSGDVMEASRLIATFGRAGDPNTGDFAVGTCGSEIVQWVDVFAVNPATQALRYVSLRNNTRYVVANDEQLILNSLSDLCMLANFDWAPRCEIIFQTSDSGLRYLGSNWDIDNCVNIKEEDLDYLNIAALYSLFNVESR